MSLSVFITGGTSGIGLGLAKHYLAQGYFVGVCGRDESKFDALKDYEKASFYKVDIAIRDEIYQAVKDFSQKHGLDMIIACAGVSLSRKTQVPDFENSRQVIHTNLIGAINTFEPAIEYMIEQKKGHLVAISSVASFCGFPGVSSYSASKAGVNKLIEGYGVDLREFGITTTTIAPGFIDTPLTRKNSHPMPFLMDADVAVKKIAQAIEKKKRFYTFPFLFSRILIFLSMIPRGLFHFLFSKYTFHYAKSKD